MRKLLSMFLTLLLTAACFVSAMASEAEWSFSVPLESIRDEYLILANSAEPLTADYEPKNLETVRTRHNNAAGEADNNGIYTASNVKVQLCKTALNALKNMFAAAESDGIILYVRLGYRSWAELERSYQHPQRAATTNVPKPGETDYQTGLAVMVVSRATRGGTLESASFANSAEGQWMKKHAAEYGFIFRYPEGGEYVTDNDYEPWHLRYVGTDVAKYITGNGLTLEEFVVELNGAYTAFEQNGGNLSEALAASRLPEGAQELKVQGPDGDYEITLFHD